MRKIVLNLTIFLLIFTLLCNFGVGAAGQDATSMGSIPIIGEISQNLFPGSSDPLTVHFFYNPGCGDCAKAEPIVNRYAANHSDVRIEFHSLANQTNMDLFLSFQNAFGLQNAHVPVIFIGNRYLEGSDEIEKNLDQVIRSIQGNKTELKAWADKQSKILPDLIITGKTADSGAGTTHSPIGDITKNFFPSSSGPVIIHYFYSPTCGDCIKVKPFIEGYAKNHTDVQLESHSVVNNQTNMDLYLRFQNSYGLKHAHVPIIFIGNNSIEGAENIETNLDSKVRSVQGNQTEIREWTTRQEQLISNQTPSDYGSQYSVNPALLIVAGLGEGLNPCGLLVLALLLVSLMATTSRRTVLAVGISYIVAFFIVRLLSGFAIFSIIQIPGISQIFLIIAAIIALLAGIIQIRDGLAKDPKPLLAIPASKKGMISKYMKRASVPAGFVVGLLVGIYGMACTAGIYISILSMIFRNPVTGLLYLVLYNLLVIVPLICIVLLVFFGIPPEKVNSWREGKKSLLRVIIGVIMLVMGIIILIPMLPL